jgi:sodium transport system permease protein
MIIAMLVGITAMFSQGAQTELYFYLVPVYNSVQSMVGIFSFEAQAAHVLVTVVVNVVVSVVFGFVLTKMFNSEKCMFNK